VKESEKKHSGGHHSRSLDCEIDELDNSADKKTTETFSGEMQTFSSSRVSGTVDWYRLLGDDFMQNGKELQSAEREVYQAPLILNDDTHQSNEGITVVCCIGSDLKGHSNHYPSGFLSAVPSARE